MTYCETNAARIYMPGDNIDYLDPFFDALEAARERPVRIMHYGDSQLEGDRISSVLRESVPRTVRRKWRGVGTGRTNRPDLHIVTIRIAGRAIPTHRLWPQGYAARQQGIRSHGTNGHTQRADHIPVFHARPPTFSARFPLRSNHAPPAPR